MRSRIRCVKQSAWGHARYRRQQAFGSYSQCLPGQLMKQAAVH